MRPWLQPSLLARRVAVMGLVLAGLGAASAVQAQELGRLFTTPETRARLDQLRARHDYSKPVTRQAEETQPVPTLTVNGLVLRSDGRRTTWINGSAILEGEPTREGVQVEIGRKLEDGVRLMLPQGFRTVRLKPGEKLMLPEGRVLDAYEQEAAEAPQETGEEGEGLFERAPGAAGELPAVEMPEVRPPS